MGGILILLLTKSAEKIFNARCIILSKLIYSGYITVGVVVQWLDYLAVTQEPGVRSPTAKQVASHVVPIQWTQTALDVRYCRHGDVVPPQFPHSGST